MYDGLQISDKDALVEAKENGSEWVARDMNMSIYGYAREPEKTMFGWHCDLSAYRIEYLGTMETLSFVGLHEKANIDLALAQIAEMKKKPLTNGEKILEKYANNIEQFASSRVQGRYYYGKPRYYRIGIEKGYDTIAEALRAEEAFLASPYTEGDKG